MRRQRMSESCSTADMSGKMLPLLLFWLQCYCLLFEGWKNTITRYIFFLLVQLLDTKCQMKSICVRGVGEEHHIHGSRFHLSLFSKGVGCQYSFTCGEYERYPVVGGEVNTVMVWGE